MSYDYPRPTVFILESNLHNYLEPIAILYIIDKPYFFKAFNYLDLQASPFRSLFLVIQWNVLLSP